MAVNRFRGKAKYVPDTEQYDDDDATQADSPPSNKRPNKEEYIANTSCSPSSSQYMFTELQDARNSQKWSYLEQSDEYYKKDVGTMTVGRPAFKYKEIGTMTDPGLTCTNNKNMEIRCNEYFGSVVACELANYHVHARYNKMKAIIEMFQEK